MKFFIEKGADDFNIALSTACKIGNKKLITYLTRYASARWEKAVLQTLAQHKQKINSNASMIAVHNACIRWDRMLECSALGGHRDLVEEYLRSPGNQEGSALLCALWAASEAGNKELIQYLLSKIASRQLHVNFSVPMGRAAQRGHKDIVIWFTELGPCNWSDCVYYAMLGGHTELVQYAWEQMGSPNMMRYQLMLNAAFSGNKALVEWNINQGDTDWNGGLTGAARGGRTDLVHFFVDKGANNWNDGLEEAARKGHLELVKYFIQKGADRFEIALSAACNKDRREVIEYLLEKCSFSEHTLQGATKIAYEQHHPSLARILQDKAENSKNPNVLQFLSKWFARPDK